ncbi:MAG TPA: EAL domain-containing protein, partial [Tepidisphaeraceae bacterium]
GLKIDRSFVANAAGRRQYAAIIQAISDLAHNLGMDVVAEGVEQQPQVALLQSLRCEHAQGFFFSPPVSQAEFEKILVRGGSTVALPARSAVA